MRPTPNATSSRRRLRRRPVAGTTISNCSSQRFPFAQRLRVARGHVGIIRIGADALGNLPRARALRPLGALRHYGDALHVIERFTRTNEATLRYEVTIDDPKAYTKPWGGHMIFELKPDWNLGEMVCEDNITFSDLQKKTEGGK